MRPISITLIRNDGQGGADVSQSLSARIASLGQLSWELDEQFTKSTPGSLSVNVWDTDGVVWDWLQNSIGVTGALLRPWIVLTVGGVQRFLGLVDLTSCKRDLKALTIDIQATDWSDMCKDQILEGAAWQRPLPRVISTRVGATIGTGKTFFFFARNIVSFGGPITVQKGDYLSSSITGSNQYKVADISGNSGWWLVNLEGFAWPSGVSQATFYRISSSIADQPYFTVVEAVTPDSNKPVFSLRLDTVDWLVPGDTLTSISGTEFTLCDVDPERREITLPEAISATVLAGDKLYFSANSSAELVYEDALTLIRRALSPYGFDASRFSSPTLPRPVLAFVSLRNPAQDQDLREIYDIEPTLNNVRVLGASGQAWTGEPETGWTLSTATTRYVDWTPQLSTAPARLIPDEGPAVAPNAGSRNRPYLMTGYTQTQVLSSGWAALFPVLSTTRTVQWPDKCLCYDYSVFRRWVISGPISGSSSYSAQEWSGSTWTTAQTATWPVSGWHPCSVAPMLNVAATSGPTPHGCALLALSTDGTAWELQLAFAGSVVRLVVDAPLVKGGVLRTTPWGVYLLGPWGYGRITYSGGALSVAWAAVLDGKGTLLASSFVGVSADSIYCFARLEATNSDGSAVVETHLLNLAGTPLPGVCPILFRERAMLGCPRLLVSLRDPGNQARILGILGGRVFQVSAKLPCTIERVRVDGMSAAELVEHVAQLLCAVVVPRPDGTLQLVSRAQTGTVALTVDRTSVVQTRLSPYFFSVVRTTGAQDDIYADASGPVNGGRVLEFNSHPCIWTEGGCFALSSVYADFCGHPRRLEEQGWFFENADAAPPWESLIPWQRVSANGGMEGYLMAGKEDVVRGEAQFALLEVVS